MINRLAEPGVDLVLEDDEGWVFLLEDWEAHLERFAPAMPTIGVTVQRILADCDRRLRACARMEEQLDGQQPPGWVKRWQAEAINCKARIARSEAPARIQHGWTREANLGKVMAMPGPGGFWQMK